MESITRQFYEIPGKIMTFQSGKYLFHEGDSAKHFYIVRSGKISVMKYAENGRILTLRLATKGNVIGELILYEENPIHVFNAVAQISSEVYAIEIPTLQSYLEKKTSLSISLLKIIMQHMRKQNSKFRDLVLYGRKGAFYSTLIRFANSYGQKFSDGILISVSLTNQDLANYSATTRENVNRMLSDLRRQNIVEMHDGLICIKNIEFLRTEIQCENCGIEICNIE